MSTGEPVFIILFGAWLQSRRIHGRVVAGGAIAFVGVMLTSLGAGTPHLGDWVCTLLVLVGAMCWSLYTVLVASLARRYGALPGDPPADAGGLNRDGPGGYAADRTPTRR